MTYPSDVTDAQWEIIKPHCNTRNDGKRRKQRQLVNGVLYVKKQDVNGICCHLILAPIKPFTASINVPKKREFGGQKPP